MRPWTVLDSADTADGLLELRRRGDSDFLITIEGRVLMTSRAHSSEVGLARLGCRGLLKVSKPAVVIGGLGMGYTLRAALDCLPITATVVVAELNALVLKWCKGPLAPLTQAAVADLRVDVRIENVTDTVRGLGDRSVNAILLDLYQGPGSNRGIRDDPVYGERSLREIRRVLRPEGVLAVWTEQPSSGFQRNLTKVGFGVKRHRSGKGGLRHLIYVASLPPPAAKG